MSKLLTPLKVGIVAVIAVAGAIFALRTVQRGGLGSGEAYQVYAVLDNVLGVARRSRVVMAGIDVGFIDSIVLEGARARLNLKIRKDVPLYQDAGLAKISESLLGDKLINLSPGKDTAHPLANGGQIVNVYEEKDFGELFQKLDLITADIQTVTHSLARTIGEMDKDNSLGSVIRRMDQITKNIAELTGNLNETFTTGSNKVQRILDDVAGVTGGTRARYGEILDNVRAVTEDMRTLLANLNGIVGRGENDLKDSVGSVKTALDKANAAFTNMESITRKIDEGQGTIGRMVNDDKVLAKAESILDDASSYTHKLATLQTVIDLRSEYHFQQNAAKNYLALKLVPKSDKYYMIELIDDPRGSVSVSEECTDVNCTSKSTKVEIKDQFKFSIQFAKRFYFLGLRFGIMENSGGIGMDWYFLDDDLQFRYDLFQFGKNEYGVTGVPPRFKAMLMYSPSWLANHVYLAAGGDDFFNSKTFDYFFGAGIHFNDEDLKSIITTTGVPSP